MNRIVIELVANSHPGTLAHITGLIMRRACNIEGILCVPADDGIPVSIYIMLKNDHKIPGLLKQLNNLYDVIDIKLRNSTGIFNSIPDLAETEAHMYSDNYR